MLRTLFPRYYPRYEQSCCGEELEAFGVWLMAGGYSRQNTIGHLRRLRQAFERYGEVGADTVYSDRRLKELFVCPGVSASQAIGYRATRRAYRRFLVACGRFQAMPLSERCHFIEEYGRFLRNVRGFARSTITQHVSTVSGFLDHALGPTDPLATLDAGYVDRYLSMKSTRVTRQTLQHTVAHLRAFLGHAFDRRLIPIRLDTIDTPRTYRGEQPPRAMPWKLVQRLLRSIDRSGKAGWRDYAILHLMAHYGLRPSEIVALEVDSVDLDARTLRVRQRKTASELVLPMASPTLSVLRRYLHRGRPQCGHRELFLRVYRPSGALKHTAVCDLFAKRTRECGIPPGRYSAYSLRHAFALRLLERGVGVKAIGDVLGHRSLESTCVYLRLDIAALRAVALPVPTLDGMGEASHG